MNQDYYYFITCEIKLPTNIHHKSCWHNLTLLNKLGIQFSHICPSILLMTREICVFKSEIVIGWHRRKTSPKEKVAWL